VGGTGDDLVFGGADGDLVFGGADGDRILGNGGDDNLNGGDAGDRIYGGDGNDILSGGAGDDLLIGGLGEDELNGGSGADTLYAETGADQAFGGSEADTIFIDDETLLVDAGTGTDTVRLTGIAQPGTAGFLADLTGVFDQLGTAAVLTRITADLSNVENLTGDRGDDFLIGDAGTNVLRGALGNDTLVSGQGVDTLFGGGGADVFVFDGTNGSADQLRDIAFGTDKIGLVDGSFADINATNIAARLTINATGTVGASSVAQFIFDNSGAGFGNLSFDADGNGAGLAVLVATLSPQAGTLVAFSAADFVFL